VKKPPKNSSPAGKRKPGRAGELEQFSSPSHHTKYVLRLYVSGSTLKSARAVENIKRVCEQHLKNRYDLEVIDVYQQAHLVGDDRVVTLPALMIRLPPPRRRVTGDLSNQENVLLALGLRHGED
jgi:circadian clock protein KaiB